MAENVVQKYLTDVGEIYRTGGGVDEESYYGPLENLLNEIGRKLKPRVRCVGQLKDTGAGEPDFGFFTANQFQRSKDSRPIAGQIPERGVIECKPWKDDSFARTNSAQVSKYWNRYGLVLVTNFSDFVLVGRSDDNKPVRLESYRIAESENKFREMLEHPQTAAKEQGERFVDFLRRAMLYEAPLTEPEILAWFLASFAREARIRVEQKKNLPALEGFKKALEEALGMKFEKEKGEIFFRATLVQTLFYGVFSSWVLWSGEHRGHPNAKFNWHDTAWTLHVPMIKNLFDQIATKDRLKDLKVVEVLDWAGMVLNRVDRARFFSNFEEEHAVQYFYEPFLKEYDPELRKELGVWYTPPEIVKYQVERVDRVLREELNIADGLADEQVVVLDPCCGTGAYLVEVLKRIHKTLALKGASALTAQKVKEAARKRVFGFEILPAPFVISHLQLGLLLRSIGAPLNAEGSERAGVYLTNALTGWEPLEDPKTMLPYPELKEERDKANKVKQDSPILVILGNPPYNAFAGTSPEEEGSLVEPYKAGLKLWGKTKNYLDDLYIRFFRIAERRIVKGGKGIVCYISNFSYLGDSSYVVMRNLLLKEFDHMWFDCMNGDSRETGKLTPEGDPDPSVFSTEQNREGIRVGTAICILVRKKKRNKEAKVLFRHFWGASKRDDLINNLQIAKFNEQYEVANPNNDNYFSFKPSKVTEEYMSWPFLSSLCIVKPMLGLNENREGALQDIEKESLIARMKGYYDKTVKPEELGLLHSGFVTVKAGFHPETVRQRVLKRENFDLDQVVKYLVRPFDRRWAYISNISPFWNRSRPKLREHFSFPNKFLLTHPTGVTTPEGVPFLATNFLGEQDLIRGHAYYFPVMVQEKTESKKKQCDTPHMFQDGKQNGKIKANLSMVTREYLTGLEIKNFDENIDSAGLIWMHALAIGYSPKYLEENADGIRQDWARIPLPKTKKMLLESAELGRQIAALLDTENPVEVVMKGKIDERLKSIGVITRVEGGSIRPEKGELDLTAGWGHAGKGGVCMPGKGKYVVQKQGNEELRKVFGDETLDIYLNDAAYWKNVPKCVWDYYIGGYQVIKKWLSYREKGMLGRGMKVEEAEYVTEMARRLSALVLLQEELNANYNVVKEETWLWPVQQ